MARSAAVISVTGFVQGVGFRTWSIRQAQKFAITGWVRNLDDGSVQIFAEGDDFSIDAYAQCLKTDHPYADVENVCVRTVLPRGYSSFSIEY